MKNMRLADEFGGITGVHRTVMPPHTQAKPSLTQGMGISSQIALDSDKLDKSTGMCVISGEIKEAKMVVFIVKRWGPISDITDATEEVVSIFDAKEKAQEAITEYYHLDEERDYMQDYSYSITTMEVR